MHPDTGDTLSNGHCVYRKLDSAIVVMQPAQQCMRRDASDPLNRLLTETGSYEEAEQLLTRALAGAPVAFSDDDPTATIIQSNMARHEPRNDIQNTKTRTRKCRNQNPPNSHEPTTLILKNLRSLADCPVNRLAFFSEWAITISAVLPGAWRP
jgi:hypothetical protein